MTTMSVGTSTDSVATHASSLADAKTPFILGTRYWFSAFINRVNFPDSSEEKLRDELFALTEPEMMHEYMECTKPGMTIDDVNIRVVNEIRGRMNSKTDNACITIHIEHDALVHCSRLEEGRRAFLGLGSRGGAVRIAIRADQRNAEAEQQCRA